MNTTETKKNELILDAFDKPVRRVFQLDCWDEVPFYNDLPGDEDGDAMIGGYQDELRRTDIPVRLQIMAGTSQETALRMLRKMVAWIERFPQSKAVPPVSDEDCVFETLPVGGQDPLIEAALKFWPKNATK